MTILWCGGEDVDFPYPSSIGVTTNASYYDPDYCRCAVWCESLPYAHWSTNFSDEVVNFWASFYLATGWNAWSHRWIGIINSDTLTSVKGLYLGSSAYNGTYYKIALYKWDGTTETKLSEETNYSFVNSGHARFDISISDYGSESIINIYFNGVLIISYEGDSSVTDVSGLNAIAVAPNIYNYLAISRIIISDEDTRLMHLKTISPESSGDTNDWTGAYTDIDETTISDADKIYSATNNADFQANLTGMPSGTYSVKAVKIAARCVNGSGTTGIQLGIKSGVTVDSGVTQTASGYWQTKERLMQVNPVTGVAFTPAEIEALQVNLRAKTL